jgi:pyruvate/2-oxoglutarate dehydrogenase complex dihydrolipoamide acyltransferase (E2) component
MCSERRNAAMVVEIEAPELGPNVTEITIVKWHKEIEELVEKGEVLVELMTDKVNNEMESPVTGIVLELLYEKDEVVKVGEVMARIEEKNGSPS